MPQRIFNFSAGPATLPLSVLEEAQRNLLEYPGAGASILEISHRSAAFSKILEETQANLRELLSIPENFKILFLQGGASTQFSMIPMNLLRGTGKTALFLNTGSWSKKAVTEAEKEGAAKVLWDGKPNFDRVPDPTEYIVDTDAAYLHFTSNETIQGVQFATEPESAGVPLICDASSDFLSRPLPMEKYALIYAGAQKNAGPAGVTMVIIRDDLLTRVPPGLHTMLDFRAMAEGESVYNTPPVFSIYIVQLVTRWLKNEIGGLAKIAERNQEKAGMLYDAIDNSDGFYRGHANARSRSNMNVTWRLPNEELETKFLSQAKQKGLHELKGHRSVGGIRASIYNAMSVEGVTVLRDFMLEFRAKN